MKVFSVAGGVLNPNLDLSDVVDGEGTVFRSLWGVLTMEGWTMPGEQEETDVGVVSLLPHIPVEPEYWVEGLPMEDG